MAEEATRATEQGAHCQQCGVSLAQVATCCHKDTCYRCEDRNG